MSFIRLFDSENKKDPASQQEETPLESNRTPSESSFAQNEAETAVEKIVTVEGAQPFYERDNRAFRIQRISQANEFWNEYEKQRPNTPFLRYVFDNKLQALEALLSVTCIHEAADTGHLICTEPITVGCYRTIDGRYEAFLAGEKLTYKVWSEATEKFSSGSGKYRNQHKPETQERYKRQKSASQQVAFKKEYYQIELTCTKFYRIFEASTTQAAWAFLLHRENVITDHKRFIHVETPEGIICRDANGVHRLGADEYSANTDQTETTSPLEAGPDEKEKEVVQT